MAWHNYLDPRPPKYCIVSSRLKKKSKLFYTFPLQQQENLVPIMKRPSHLQVVPDHESSHLRELLRVKDQELKGRHLPNLLYFRPYSYP